MEFRRFIQQVKSSHAYRRPHAHAAFWEQLEICTHVRRAGACPPGTGDGTTYPLATGLWSLASCGTRYYGDLPMK
ncbi:unnamed protein product [Ambrosiozyma monospora]|uniref:Unnamed protein product n=1 Tax=Ambrosiozyma monospora TaxID=43982 RepID=A0ACB5U7R3_AMBMO|nr:unnamed protein product [Ambrosiozyma monospora]